MTFTWYHWARQLLDATPLYRTLQSLDYTHPDITFPNYATTKLHLTALHSHSTQISCTSPHPTLQSHRLVVLHNTSQLQCPTQHDYALLNIYWTIPHITFTVRHRTILCSTSHLQHKTVLTTSVLYIHYISQHHITVLHSHVTSQYVTIRSRYWTSRLQYATECLDTLPNIHSTTPHEI